MISPFVHVATQVQLVQPRAVPKGVPRARVARGVRGAKARRRAARSDHQIGDRLKSCVQFGFSLGGCTVDARLDAFPRKIQDRPDAGTESLELRDVVRQS